MRRTAIVSLAALACSFSLFAPACQPPAEGGEDAGLTDHVDAGLNETDAGLNETDAGPNEDDSGLSEDDSSTPDDGGAADAGSRAPAALTFIGEGSKAIDPAIAYAPTAVDGIPPFSSASLRVSVRNDEASTVTIKTIEIEPVVDAGVSGGTLADEYAISVPGSTLRKPFSLDGTNLEPGAAAEFGLHFIAYASGPRKARVIVVTSDDREASFFIGGRGRDNLVLSPAVGAPLERVFARPKADFKVSGIASDGDGGAVVSMNANEVLDLYSRDLAIIGISPDGSQRWAKIWNENYQQESPDPGQNSESGGSADSIAYGGDGHVYVSARRSLATTNNTFQALVLKIDASTGALAWSKGFTNGKAVPEPKESEQAYGLDASLADRVLITGESGGSDQRMLLLALSKTDGSKIFGMELKVASGYTDRGYTIRTDPSGNGYIGGVSSGRAVLVRLAGLNGSAPTVTWVRDLGMGTGSNINSLVLAANGDAIVSLDHRGAITKFAAARIKTDGTVAWSKTWDSGVASDRNNTYFVRENGGVVYVGGRIAIQTADTVHGDGFLLGLDAQTGGYKFGALYYSGKGTDSIAQHRVKGLVFSGNDVFGVTHGTTVANNTAHYWGYWYQAPDDKLVLPAGNGSERLVDYPLTLKAPASAIEGISNLAAGQLHAIDTASIWKDFPSSGTFWGEPRGYEGETPQEHPVFSKLALTP